MLSPSYIKKVTVRLKLLEPTQSDWSHAVSIGLLNPKHDAKCDITPHNACRVDEQMQREDQAEIKND